MPADGGTIGQLGEFPLIGRLSSILGPDTAVVGIGDDAAVIDRPGPDYTLATVDMLVAGVHFHEAVDPRAIGRHGMAVSVSDIAAMGGQPEYALVSLALPPLTPVSFVEDVYRGLDATCAAFGVSIVGGNMARAHGDLALDIVLLGRVAKGDLILRRGAVPGDVLAVTGTLGRIAADRRQAMQAGTSWSRDVEPRVSAGQSLAREHLVHAMMDISDGLGGDLYHLCQASGVGAVLYEDQLPVAIQLRRMAESAGLDPYVLALSGGEDYELLIAMAERDIERARAAAGAVPLTVIGTVLPRDQGITIERPGGHRTPLDRAGWQHF